MCAMLNGVVEVEAIVETHGFIVILYIKYCSMK